MKLVEEFDGEFQLRQGALAMVDYLSGQSCYFLMEEILRAAEGDAFDFYFAA